MIDLTNSHRLKFCENCFKFILISSSLPRDWEDLEFYSTGLSAPSTALKYAFL
jgi:hypothetical protein